MLLPCHAVAMLRKKRVRLLAVISPPLLVFWLLASAASWRPRRLAHLPLGPKNAKVQRFEISPLQDLVLTQVHVQAASQWRVLQLSTGKTLWNHTTALWEGFALRPDGTGFVAMELQPDVASTNDETFYRPIFGDFASQSERQGETIALREPNVVTNVAFSRDGKSVYGLFTRDAAQWNMDSGTLERRISIGDPWSDEFYPSKENRASLDFMPDTTIYAQATNKYLSFWNFETARKLFQVPPMPAEAPFPAMTPISSVFTIIPFRFVARFWLWCAPMMCHCWSFTTLELAALCGARPSRLVFPTAFSHTTGNL